MSGKRRGLPARLECEHVLPIAERANVENIAQRLILLLVRGGLWRARDTRSRSAILRHASVLSPRPQVVNT